MTSKSDLTPAEINWYKNVYQGDVPQLTFRSVIMGSFIGGFMALSNLYVGLKTGWGLGVAITSTILSYTIYKTLHKSFPRFFKTEMSLLETSCMQLTASSAGAATGSTMVSAIAAYLLVTGVHIPWPVLALWTFFLAGLGVFLAIPMKRQMINVEQLKFPSGIAAAETLKGLFAEGRSAIKKTRVLGGGGLVGAAVAWFRDAGLPFSLPGLIKVPGTINGIALTNWTINIEISTIMIAAGAIMGFKIAWSLLLGATINYAFLAPAMVKLGVIDASKLGYRAIVAWSTWAGASIMVTSGITAFLMQWKMIARSLSKFRVGKNTKNAHEFQEVEVPNSWFVSGTLLFALGCIWLLYTYFHTTLVMGIIAVALTFVLALVACRACGETDITPLGAMGKITQLTFGILAPSNIVTNLMTASVTSGAAAASADLLSNLKSGYLLGANPRKQFLAQALGMFAGVLVVVPAFYILVPDAKVLGSDMWPAPAAQVWAAVARLLANGLHTLHPTALWGIVIGGSIGIIIPLLERVVSDRVRAFIPSAMGLGLSMVIPFFNSLSMFIGAMIALVMSKKLPKLADNYLITAASGLIAGESIMGIIVAILFAMQILA